MHLNLVEIWTLGQRITLILFFVSRFVGIVVQFWQRFSYLTVLYTQEFMVDSLSGSRSCGCKTNLNHHRPTTVIKTPHTSPF